MATWWGSRDPPEGDGPFQSVAPKRGDAPLDAIVLDELEPTPDRLEWLQGHLRPGGLLWVRHAPQPKRLARRLRSHFEGGTPSGRERFIPVRAGPDGVRAWRRGPGIGLAHFEELAPHYRAQIPPHLAAYYQARKLAVLRRALPDLAGKLGLDLGCGIGAHALAVQQATDARVVGVDAAVAAAGEANRAGVAAAAADVLQLPFRDGAFAFAYTINVLHHLKRGEQRRALAELARVLEPGAPLVVFEINVRNPLFRFYMRKVFPRLRDIDRGDEEFLDPRRLELPPGLQLDSTHYSTFVPDFTPRFLLGAARALERLLERAMPSQAIHVAYVLRSAPR